MFIVNYLYINALEEQVECLREKNGDRCPSLENCQEKIKPSGSGEGFSIVIGVKWDNLMYGSIHQLLKKAATTV